MRRISGRRNSIGRVQPKPALDVINYSMYKFCGLRSARKRWTGRLIRRDTMTVILASLIDPRRPARRVALQIALSILCIFAAIDGESVAQIQQTVYTIKNDVIGCKDKGVRERLTTLRDSGDRQA